MGTECFYLDYNEISMDPINVPDEEMVETIVIEDDKTPKKVEDHTTMDDDIEEVTEDVMTWIDEMQEFTEDDAAKLAAIEVVVEDEKEDGTEENTLEEAAIDSKENHKM